MAENRAWDKNN